MAIAIMDEQTRELFEQMRTALTKLEALGEKSIPAEPTDAELLDLPFDKIVLEDSLLSLPGRRSANRELAENIARLLYPSDADSLTSIIRYEQDRVQICRWIRHSRRYYILLRKRQHEEHDWRLHIEQQGPWDPVKQPISLTGPPSLPMPVEVATAESLEPFFAHLRTGGTHEQKDTLDASLPLQEIAEPFYGTPALEFPRGVVYKDRRLDLCKMVVGPTHIGTLMESLRMNTFIKHFLLGNNIIGPTGAQEIASFVRDLPNRIDTWYLAGNAMHGVAFSELVDVLVTSPAVTNVWLKRNPLGTKGGRYVDDIFRLITRTPNLRTLDLDQTEFGDAGVAELFEKLLAYGKAIKLEILYLNGNGIGVKGAAAIGRYFASPHCSITSLYMSNNPVGDDGANALSSGLRQNRTLQRLTLQSVGLGDSGVGALADALLAHPTLKVLDVGTSYATEDLGQAYNVLSNACASEIIRLINAGITLEYLDLGAVIMDIKTLNSLLEAAATTKSLLFYNAVPTARKRQQHRDTDLEHTRLKQLLKARLTTNVQAKHGEDMTYDEWHADEKRWVVSDKTDVRKIDSVYRTRDMGLARRGLKKLDKWWTDANEGTLMDALGGVEGAVGPVCTAPKKSGFWAQNGGIPIAH